VQEWSVADRRQRKSERISRAATPEQSIAGVGVRESCKSN